FKKGGETPEWQDFMKKGAFNTTFMAGDDYKAWLAKTADLHRQLMEEAGFLASKGPCGAPGPAPRPVPGPHRADAHCRRAWMHASPGRPIGSEVERWQNRAK